nr:sentrin-specific protease 8 isoform X1 [Chlorocebus sabaeus]
MAEEAEATEGRTIPGGWTQQPHGPGERPLRIPRPVRETPPGLGRHIPRCTPPREHALDRRLNCCQRPPLPVQLLPPSPPLAVLTVLYSLYSHSQPSPRPLSASAARPRPCARNPAPRDSTAAGEQARAHLPPTPPTASQGRPRPVPPGPAPARDATGEYSVRLRGHAPFPRPQAAPPKFFFLTLRQSGELCLRFSLYWRGMSQGWGRNLWVCDCSCRFPANTEVSEGWLGW